MRKFVYLLLAFIWSVHAQAATYQFAVIGDAGKWNENSQSVRDSILRLGVDRLILPGDNNYNNSRENQTAPMEERLANYHQEWSPWADFLFDAVALGNHNLGYDAEITYFNSLKPGGHEEYYSRTIGSQVRLIVLNSDNKNNVAEQIHWLREQLETAKEEFIFLVYHHPTYTIPFGHVWMERADFQRAIRPVIKRYAPKITALLLGHDHVAAQVDFGSMPAFVSGAVKGARWGLPLHYIATDGTLIRTRFFSERKPHWLRLVIDDEAMTATASFISADNDQVVYERSF